MGLPKHVRRFVYSEIRSLEFYRREQDFHRKRLEEIDTDLGSVLLPQFPEGERVQGKTPSDPAALRRVYLVDEREWRQERLKVLQQKINIINGALNVLDPEKEHAIRWAATTEKDRAPLWQIADRHHVCEKTIYNWQREAVEKIAPLLLGVFGR